MKNGKLLSLVLTFLVVGLTSGAAMAGTGGSAEFGTIYTMLDGWMTGVLGKVIALTSLGVGLTIGVIRQSIMAVVTGVSMGIASYYGPDVINSIVSATL